MHETTNDSQIKYDLWSHKPQKDINRQQVINGVNLDKQVLPADCWVVFS